MNIVVNYPPNIFLTVPKLKTSPQPNLTNNTDTISNNSSTNASILTITSVILTNSINRTVDLHYFNSILTQMTPSKK